MVKHATVQPKAAEAKGCLSLQMKSMIYNLTGCNQILLFLLLCPLQTVLVQGLTVLACSGTGLGRFKWDLAKRRWGRVCVCACVWGPVSSKRWPSERQHESKLVLCAQVF